MTHKHAETEHGLLGLLGLINTELEAGQDTHALALSGDLETELQDMGRHICFELGGGLLAIPLSLVLEVGELQILEPLPLLPAWLSGITNIRGEIMSVVDLARFMGQSGERSLKQSPFFVAYDDTVKMVITVGRLLGTRTLYRPHEDMAGDEKETAVAGKFFAGRALYKEGDGGQEVELFDLNSFLASRTLRDMGPR
jgi:chemotaxis signal transduction protein